MTEGPEAFQDRAGETNLAEEKGQILGKILQGCKFRLLSCKTWSTASLNQAELGGNNASASAEGFAGAGATGLTADEKVYASVCMEGCSLNPSGSPAF